MDNGIKHLDEPRWFVCYTKPRCEKKFAALLEAESLEHYLPLVLNVRKYGARIRKSEKPLFTGYVFTRVEPEKKNRIYQQDFVVRILMVEDQALFVRQLEAVKTIVASGLRAVLAPLVKKGARVVVIKGPLKGIEGYVDDPENPKGVMVNMDVLQQGILVPVQIDDIRVLD